ncbi:hypothetical protein J6590_044900 [Homalodisca vitripennis]|nr:hypothetical protein J6590_044900 [Homalodisca vitripennis]
MDVVVPECTQLEDPRLEWRAIQEAMLRDYLHTAQDVLECGAECGVHEDGGQAGCTGMPERKVYSNELNVSRRAGTAGRGGGMECSSELRRCQVVRLRNVES